MIKIKIGYVRFNLPVDLDYYNASSSSLGTELRCGIIESLLQQGHEVTIFSLIKKSHLHILEGKGENFDYSLFKKLKYKPEEYAQDIDILFIEGAQGRNTMFRQLYKGEEVPFIWRAFDLINNFKGKVIYYHHGNKDMKFPFSAFFQDLGKGTDKWNLRVMAKRVDFFKDKEWKILTHSDNKDYLDYLYDDINKYKIDLNYDNIPVCYSENFDKRYLPKEKPSKNLLFIGSERNKNRRNKILKFYSGLGFKSNIIGKWESTMPEDVILEGQIKGHGKVYELLNDSYSCVQIGDEEFEKYGQITTRPIQVIRSGCILFSDYDYKGMEKYVGNYCLLKTRDESREKIQKVLDMSYEERLKVNELQNKKIKKWNEINWEKVLI